MKKRNWLFILVLVLFSMFEFLPLNAHAIDNSPAWSFTKFDFSPAGARARGFGGAFVGLANDATAALINPAGLAQLPKKQFALELSSMNSYSEDRPWIKDTTGTVDIDSYTGVSFCSFSLPIFDNLYGSIFYNKLAQQDSTTFLPDAGVIADFKANTHLSISEYGISGATEFGNGRFQVGAGISLVYLDLDNQVNSTQYQSIESVSPTSEIFYSSAGDNGIAYRIGGLWKANENLQIGISANIYPTLDFRTEINDRFVSLSDLYTDSLDGIIDNPLETLTLDDELNIPDIFAVGLSYQLGDNWIFSFETKYTQYSQIKISGISPSSFRETAFQNGTMAPWGQVYLESTPDDYEFEDAWSWHFGCEYLSSIKGIPLAIRLGGYFEQAHAMKYTGKESDYETSDLDNSDLPYAYDGMATRLGDLLDGGDDIWHFTPGIGVVFANSYQIDLSIDLSEEQDECLLSLVYQF